MHKRFRKDMGDLTSLKDSIAELGLLQPIVVDENNNLIAGERRLRACKELKMKDILVNIVKIDEKSNVQAEFDENTVRKNFAPSESVAIWDSLMGQSGKRNDLRDNVPEVDSPRKQASKFLDGSEKKLSQAKQVVESGNKELIQKMDETGNVNRAYQEVKREEIRQQVNKEVKLS